MSQSTVSQLILAYSYIRFSSVRQERGHSLTRQETAAEAWAARNNAKLDNSSYRDLGVSAFTGAHRQNPDRNGLAMFLRAVEEGKVPKGSFLLVENLDRLTREHLRAALSLFLSILDAGVHVVSLSPERVFRADATGDDVTMDIMIAIVELSRGNRESARKSDMIGKNWEAARNQIQAGELPTLKNGKRGMPCQVPFWLVRTKTGYELNEKAEAVRFAFRLARNGFGVNAVRLKVNEKFGLMLSRAYIQELLPRSTRAKTRTKRPRGRLVLGEHQPCNKSGQPIGDVVQIYPAVITEAEWHEVQAAVNARDNGGGSRDRQRIYIFNRLMVDEHGEGFTVGKASVGRGAHKFIPKRYLDGKGPCVSFPIKPFETAILASLRELRAADVLSNMGRPGGDKILAHTGKRDELRRLIAETADAMRPGQEIAQVVRRMGEWQTEVEELERRIAELKAKEASPQAEAWGELQRAVDVEDEETRARLRSAVARVVEKMTCVFGGHGRYRLAMVQVDFKDSPHNRKIAVYYRAATNTFKGLREEELVHDTWTELPVAGHLTEQVEAVRQFLVDFATEREEHRRRGEE
ncbi:MAG TPA: recombinase family protein [Urbifossiella sp.]|jgi:DNA invertase Pin-like site-specific DNA recombinase|nr:recombinase family protein [Urbifossiella sp.]